MVCDRETPTSWCPNGHLFIHPIHDQNYGSSNLHSLKIIGHTLLIGAKLMVLAIIKTQAITGQYATKAVIVEKIGLLRAEEILDMDLQAELVVLSA